MSFVGVRCLDDNSTWVLPVDRIENFIPPFDSWKVYKVKFLPTDSTISSGKVLVGSDVVRKATILHVCDTRKEVESLLSKKRSAGRPKRHMLTEDSDDSSSQNYCKKKSQKDEAVARKNVKVDLQKELLNKSSKKTQESSLSSIKISPKDKSQISGPRKRKIESASKSEKKTIELKAGSKRVATQSKPICDDKDDQIVDEDMTQFEPGNALLDAAVLKEFHSTAYALKSKDSMTDIFYSELAAAYGKEVAIQSWEKPTAATETLKKNSPKVPQQEIPARTYDPSMDLFASQPNTSCGVDMSDLVEPVMDFENFTRAQLIKRIHQLMKENESLQSLNVKYQADFLKSLEDIIACASSRISGSVGPSTQASSIRSSSCAPEDQAVRYTTEDGKIHLGLGIFIPKASHDIVNFKAVSASTYVRHLAEVVFGTEAILSSTPKGKSSKGLDPLKLLAMKASLRKWLEERGTSELSIDLVVEKFSDFMHSAKSDLKAMQKRATESSGGRATKKKSERKSKSEVTAGASGRTENKRDAAAKGKKGNTENNTSKVVEMEEIDDPEIEGQEEDRADSQAKEKEEEFKGDRNEDQSREEEEAEDEEDSCENLSWEEEDKGLINSEAEEESMTD